jgi:hypothetical protein
MLWIPFSLAISIKENIPGLKEINLLENHFKKVEGQRWRLMMMMLIIIIKVSIGYEDLHYRLIRNH